MSIIHDRPDLADHEIVLAFESLFKRTVNSVKMLDGERDQNAYVKTNCGGEFVFKICNPSEPRELLQAQNAAMDILCTAKARVPRLLRTIDCETLPTFHDSSGSFLVRAVEWIPGIPLAKVTQPSRSLIYEIGNELGKIDASLQGFDQSALHRRFEWNLKNGIDVITARVGAVTDDELRSTIISLADRIGPNLAAAEPNLRQAVIHNDANDYNVIVTHSPNSQGDRSVCGIIDFGDLAWTYVAAELAIAMAYVVCNRRDWMTAVCELTAGFCQTFALLPAEVDVLFDLLLLRLGTSVCMSASQQADRPGDPYLSISQSPIRSLLPILAKADSNQVCDGLRAACESVA